MIGERSPLSRYVFVTGRLARRALEGVLRGTGIDYEVRALDRAVAALMDTEFIAGQLGDLAGAEDVELVMIPGLCNGTVDVIERATGCRAVKGPNDLKDIPSFLGLQRREGEVPEPTAKIMAEIVGAPALTVDEIVRRARYYRDSGADIIDLGAEVSEPFPLVREAVRALKAEGFCVSIDTLRAEDLLAANEVGVDYVLSVNSTNMHIAAAMRCPVVVIPDEDGSLDSLSRNVESLERLGKQYIIDPILRPLTMGFAQSMYYYWEARRRFPYAPMLMGVANVTELTDADSVGINAVLAGVAAELGVDYLLTTEHSARTRGAVRELDRARRLMRAAMHWGTLPKHVDYSLLVVKEPQLSFYSEEELREMQSQITDRNFRIFVGESRIYAFNNRLFAEGTSADAVFAALGVSNARHAFYLGKELCKAEMAFRLGKKYVQDQDLRWGYMSDRDHRGHRLHGE